MGHDDGREKISESSKNDELFPSRSAQGPIRRDAERLPKEGISQEGQMQIQFKPYDKDQDCYICPRGEKLPFYKSRPKKRKKKKHTVRVYRSVRQHTVEPPFGNIKHNLGFRSFCLRGLPKVSGEFAIMCSAHNLLKLCSEVLSKGEVWLESQLACFSIVNV
jgi:hypothetical protein